MTNPAAALNALRRRVDHICPVCEKGFKAIKKAVYCSEACKQKAKYKRSKQNET